MLLAAACNRAQRPDAAPSKTVSQSPPSSQLADLPLSEARVEGRFRGPGLGGLAFTFEPLCLEGSCDLRADRGVAALRFEKSDGTYRANDTFLQRCGRGALSFPYSVRQMFRLVVVDAKFVEGEWRATVLKVTTEHKSPGGSKTLTSGADRVTRTCKGVHKTKTGRAVLEGRP